jgi:hypothetical protein
MIKYICPYCEGDQFNKYIEHDWNVKTQAWEAFHECQTVCTNCHNEIEPIAVDLSPEEAESLPLLYKVKFYLSILIKRAKR